MCPIYCQIQTVHSQKLVFRLSIYHRNKVNPCGAGGYFGKFIGLVFRHSYCSNVNWNWQLGSADSAERLVTRTVGIASQADALALAVTDSRIAFHSPSLRCLANIGAYNYVGVIPSALLEIAVRLDSLETEALRDHEGFCWEGKRGLSGHLRGKISSCALPVDWNKVGIKTFSDTRKRLSWLVNGRGHENTLHTCSL